MDEQKNNAPRHAGYIGLLLLRNQLPQAESYTLQIGANARQATRDWLSGQYVTGKDAILKLLDKVEQGDIVIGVVSQTKVAVSGDCLDDKLMEVVLDESKLVDAIGAALPLLGAAIVRRAARAVVQAASAITDAKLCPYCGDIIEPDSDTCGGEECDAEEAAYQAELAKVMP